jgi:hypothetical protein
VPATYRSLRAAALLAHGQFIKVMGKEIPRSFERLRSGEHLQIPTFANVAAATAAGVTAAKFPRRIIHLSAGGTGSVPCIAISDGTNWKQIAIGNNAI